MAATSEHCFYCFDVLISHLESKRPPRPNFKDDEYPLFVTWTTNAYGDDRLRGCIGNFNAMPLCDGLKEYALISAFKDRRFSPIKSHEVPQLSCGVSLLEKFEPGKDEWDWEIGKHGIWIEFEMNGRSHTATYLPDVPVDQEWTKEETIDSLLRKGGYHGKGRPKIQLTRYQSSKAKASFEDYLEQDVERKADIQQAQTESAAIL